MTVVADTIYDKTTGTPILMELFVTGSNKCWWNLDGSGTVTERDSFNVSTFDDNATGNFDANFTGNMNNANYSLAGFTNNTDGNYGQHTMCYNTSGFTTTFINFMSNEADETATKDSDMLCGGIQGDLA